MVTDTRMTMAKEEEKAPTTSKGLRPMLTEQAITAISYDLKMAEKLVTFTLEEQIDYGQIPGVAGKGLWDPGAAKIMNAFQCYPRHKVLYHEETDSLITWAIEAEIISRETQQIVGAGVGACSTREPKYKYRWVENAEAKRLGYTEPEIEQMKKKKGKRWTGEGKVYEVDEYRVENPEYGEQVNTIAQMAAKRAETDAAKTLPGVASALRKLFDSGKSERRASGKKKQTEDIDENSPRWTSFWNAARNLLGEDYQARTHQMLGVKSMADWLKSGRSLDEALKEISEKLSKRQGEKKQVVEPKQEVQIDRKAKLEEMSAAKIPNTDCLEAYVTLFFHLEPEALYRELGYKSKQNFLDAGVTKPWDAFLAIKDAHQGPPEEPPTEPGPENTEPDLPF